MELEGRAKIERFKVKHSSSRRAMNGWIKVVEDSQWNNHAELKQTFPKADYVRDRMVYRLKVGGNNYRIIAKVSFDKEKVILEEVMTMRNTTSGKGHKKPKDRTSQKVTKVHSTKTTQKKKKTLVVVPPDGDYMDLVEKFPLRKIQTEEENDAALIISAELMTKSLKGVITPGEDAYWEVLSLLIQKFESEAYPIEKSTPAEILAFMMEQHDLKQIDLIPELGTQSTVSAVLNGKRKLTRDQIQALSKRFNISPALFFD